MLPGDYEAVEDLFYVEQVNDLLFPSIRLVFTYLRRISVELVEHTKDGVDGDEWLVLTFDS